MSKYSRVETTDNLDFDTNQGHDDFQIDDTNDDIFITPDVETPLSKESKPGVTKSNTEIPSGSINNGLNDSNSSSNNNNNTNFFNLSSFITPQLPSIVQIETRERPFTGGNTLDESVLTTLYRDLSTIGDKLLSILWPLRLRQSLISVRKISNRFTNGSGNDVEDVIVNDNSTGNNENGLENEEYSLNTMNKIRDWDLWGPLVLNLSFSLIITYLQSKSIDKSNDNDTSSQIFSGAFTLIWTSLAVLSINIQLLTPVQQQLENGNMTNGIIGLSFFQCISLLSYALFPVILGGFTSIFIPFKFVRLIINILMLCWSLLCTWLILAIVNNCKTQGSLSSTFDIINGNEDDSSAGDKRIFLMIYPVFLVFGLFSWFCVIV